MMQLYILHQNRHKPLKNFRKNKEELGETLVLQKENILMIPKKVKRMEMIKYHQEKEK